MFSSNIQHTSERKYYVLKDPRRNMVPLQILAPSLVFHSHLSEEESLIILIIYTKAAETVAGSSGGGPGE